MSWLILVVAGLFEAGFASCLGMAKIREGMSAMLWYGAFLICLSVSMYLLIIATKSLPVGTAYAVWTGIGAIGTVLIGIIYFDEPVSAGRIFFFRC